MKKKWCTDGSPLEEGINVFEKLPAVAYVLK